MGRIEYISELTNDIITTKGKIERYKSVLSVLDKSTSIGARMSIEPNGIRTRMYEYLTNSEARLVFDRRLKEEEEKLIVLETRFNEIVPEKPQA
jgi:hypothetical protein